MFLLRQHSSRAFVAAECHETETEIGARFTGQAYIHDVAERLEVLSNLRRSADRRDPPYENF